jgi:hypothetical protein
MSTRTAAWLAYSIVALAVLLVVLGSLLLLVNDRFPPPSGDILLAFVPFLIVGVLIASRRPENAIGWMFCVIGLASVWQFFAQEYAYYALITQPGALPGGAWIAWTALWTSSVWALMLFALLLFPNGRLPSPRWRPFAWVAAAVFTLGVVLLALEPGRLPEVRVRNPTGIEQVAGIMKLSQSILIPVTLGIILAIGASVVVRFRRARGEEREQLKWLAYSVGVLVSMAALAFLNFQVLDNPFPFIGIVVPVVSMVAVAGIPVAIGVAILRYRLYEIDIVINRTLVYGSLTASLAALYFGGVATTQALLRALTGQEQQPQLAIVVSTLVIAALFNPLRRRIQRFIDRRFYRSKYDAAKTLEAFSAKLRDETDLDTLSDDLVGVVSETMQPAHVSLWLRPDTPPQREQAD